jgi:hypothetical protein
MFKEKIKKYLAVLIIIFMVLHSSLLPAAVFAQEVTPETSPTPANTIDNGATVSNDTQATSNTGDNTVNPSSTPTPEDTITPTPNQESTIQSDAITPTPTYEEPTPTLDPNASTIDNSATVSSNLNSEGNSGNNTVTPPCDSLHQSCGTSSGGNNAINTGNALSLTDIQNALNTTSLNSEVVYQTINIFMNEDGNLDLSDPFTIASQVIPQHADDSIINVSVTNVNNYAYLSNNIISYANTGNNTINGGGYGMGAVINTGDAYSIVSLLNKVNFTVVNSKIHIVVINVFGDLNGNIILPELTAGSAPCATCGVSTNLDNQATVVNTVDSKAVSGENTVTGYRGNIQTGDALSAINNINLVNQNFIGTILQGLFVNIFGGWNGDFLGWSGLEGLLGGQSFSLFNTGPLLGSSDCGGCATNLNVSNDATVLNNIWSFANTGNNDINAKKGNITTGNAYSAVSLINLINSNFINSIGFLGFINIFGNWHGDIGGKNQFTQTEVSNESTTQSSDERQTGGQLAITQTNNVGQFVYPGDTITIFAKIKNTGTGKVYGAKLGIFLVEGDQNKGWKGFDLGDIEAGKSVKFSTGMVLSKNIKPGKYIIRAIALGNTGPDDSEVTAMADSNFSVFGNSFVASAQTGSDEENNSSVLGTNNLPSVSNKNAATTDRALYALLAIVMTYILIRGIRQRENIKEIFTKNISIKEKMVALRMFLL